MDIADVKALFVSRPDAGVLIGAHTSAIATVLRPLLQNILRTPTEAKFRTFRAGNPKIAAALSTTEVMPRYTPLARSISDSLRNAGFTVSERDGDQFWTLPEDVSVVAVDMVLGELRKEEDALRTLGNQIDILARSSVSSGGTQARTAPAHKAARPSDDPRRLEILAQIEREQKERRDNATNDAKSELQNKAQNEADFEEGSKVLNAIQLILHKTGRLRNSSFGAQGMTVRKMTSGRRVYHCGDPRCADGMDGQWGYEVHWHQRTGNLLYSFVAHISPDCSAVLHVGDEYGYQYCNLPGEANFGKTVLLNIKKWNHTTLSVEGLTHFCKPANCCIYCQRSFTNDLWL